MFEKFLTLYIQNLIECSFDEYEITDEEIKDAASTIEANEHIWSILDEAVYQEIEKYKTRGSEEEIPLF